VNTVRTHIKRIYGKLGVHSRYEAVERAKELNLL
jgi:LuxR family maltose regulon positive regulatory protein